MININTDRSIKSKHSTNHNNSSQQIYSWGFGKYGQLGWKFINISTKPININLPTNEQPDKISLGECFSSILTQKGNIYLFGNNTNGQAGISPSEQKNIPKPEKLKFEFSSKITKISCGAEHSLLLSEDGLLFSFGLNLFGQLGIGKKEIIHSHSPINISSEMILLTQTDFIKDISAGAHHSSILTFYNKIYTCGYGNNMSLGHMISSSNSDYKSYTFKEIDYKIPYKTSISNITSGFYHTACVVDNEKIYIWGKGRVLKYDQPENLEYKPQSKGFKNQGDKIKDIGIGIDIIVILTYNSEIYIIGDNSKYQQGNLSQIDNQSFELVRINNILKKSKSMKHINTKERVVNKEKESQLLPTEENDEENQCLNMLYNISQVNVGYEFVIILVEYNNTLPDNEGNVNLNREVYGWGSNEFGQLGSSSNKYIKEPTVISVLSNIKKVSCGGYHCLGIDDENYVKEEEGEVSYSNKITETHMQKGEIRSKSINLKKKEKNEDEEEVNIIPKQRTLSFNDMSLLQNKSNENKEISLLNDKSSSQTAYEQMKSLLSSLPLSSTSRNDYFLYKEKNKILSELVLFSKQLEDVLRKKEFQISSLIQEEKELLDKLGYSTKYINKGLSRGFDNNFEVDKSEILITGELGKGTFGVVYKAVWRKENIAMKVLKEELLSQEDNLKSFYEECHFLKNLRHPNILLFMGANTTGPDYFIITEMCDYGNLFDLLHHKKNITINWEDRRRIALEICYGMNYLHSFKPPILHRDLKSMNVLLTKYWQVKIADFGNTKFLQNQMTKQKGTFQWMAPEVILNTKYTEKADVFSFGIIMSELMSRTPPYYGVNKNQVAQQVASNQNFRPVIPNTCPKDWSNLMKRCWDMNPIKRPNFNEIIDLLTKASL